MLESDTAGSFGRTVVGVGKYSVSSESLFRDTSGDCVCVVKPHIHTARSYWENVKRVYKMNEPKGDNSMHRKLASVTEHDIQKPRINSRKSYNLAVSRQSQF